MDFSQDDRMTVYTEPLARGRAAKSGGQDPTDLYLSLSAGRSFPEVT